MRGTKGSQSETKGTAHKTKQSRWRRPGTSARNKEVSGKGNRGAKQNKADCVDRRKLSGNTKDNTARKKLDGKKKDLHVLTKNQHSAKERIILPENVVSTRGKNVVE